MNQDRLKFTMDDKLKYIPNDNKQNHSFCTLNYLFESLDTAITLTNQSSLHTI